MNELIMYSQEESSPPSLCRNTKSNLSINLVSYYSITLSLPEDYLEPSCPSAAVTRPTSSWLSDTLLPKLAKWATEVDPDVPLSSSHSLISVERYSNLYAELKQKYGPKFVKVYKSRLHKSNLRVAGDDWSVCVCVCERLRDGKDLR